MNLTERVKKCVSEVAGTGADTEENARLKEDAGLDSLSLVSVIVGLEDEFGIAFDDGDLDPAKIITVKDLTELVGNYI